MSISYKRRAFSAGLFVLATLGMESPVRSEITDYEFQLLQSEVKRSEHAFLAVRLIHKPTGHVVPAAVIFTHRLDMAPDAMATMKGRLEATPVHRTRDLPLEGRPLDGRQLAALARGEAAG